MVLVPAALSVVIAHRDVTRQSISRLSLVKSCIQSLNICENYWRQSRWVSE
jgi:hypothetical protein